VPASKNDPASLPPLRDIIKDFDLGARKSLGQHFIFDTNLCGRIARAAGSLEGANVIEIGPGPGGLTRAILAEGAAHVWAIEKDHRCIEALGYLVEAYPGRLDVVEGDALKIDPAAAAPTPRMIISNLPYNISTPLLIKWLKQIDDIELMVIMLQKEVADRLAAKPGSKLYGRLSVITQWLTEVSTAFGVDRRAFTPPPKVTSSVVVLKPRPEPLAPARWEYLEKVTAAAFGQRRKMLRSALKPLNIDLVSLSIDPTRRAEELSVEEFCKIARALETSGTK